MSCLRRLPIPLPSLAEQKRIAAILDKAEGIRRKRREGVEVLSSLETSLFQARFSRYFDADEAAYTPVAAFVDYFSACLLRTGSRPGRGTLFETILF